jgi:drug/metabolite transporter (DMT)-like permease
VSALLLATIAACLFGGLAVALRRVLEHGVDPETAAALTAVAGLVVAALVAVGERREADLAVLWPYLVGGAVAPGLSQVFFVRAIDEIGAARTAVLFGVSPLLAAVPAVVLLDEPLGPLLAIGTLAVVAGCIALAWERGSVRTITALGAAYALAAAVAIAARDNYARHAAVDTGGQGLLAACATLAAGSAVLVAIALVRRRFGRLRVAARPLLVAGALQGLAYCALLVALTRGRVTVVVPLYTTEALWAVVFAAVFLRRREAVDARVACAAALMVAGGALIALAPR